MKERDLKKDDSLQASDTGFSGHISLGIKHANQVWKLSQRSPLIQRVLLTTLCLHFFLPSLFVAQILLTASPAFENNVWNKPKLKLLATIPTFQHPRFEK